MQNCKKQANYAYQNSDKGKKMFDGRANIFKNLLIIAVIAVSISYLLCINDLSIKGFEIKDLKKQVQKITDDNQQMEIKIADLKSLDSVYDRAQDLRMVKVDKIEYLTTTETTVAMK